jgi:polyhydroxyalkanoate synthesis repressor PhaR
LGFDLCKRKTEIGAMQQQAQSSKSLVLKKYANRRYYDAAQSRHLTLEEIRDSVRNGSDLTVTDGTTSRDITGQVLTQIILDFETPKLDLLPVPLLLHLVRLEDHAENTSLGKYFSNVESEAAPVIKPQPAKPPPPRPPSKKSPKVESEDAQELLDLLGE